MLDRQSFRNQVVGLLVDAEILQGSDAERRVYKSRSAPLSVKRLPALLVYTLQQSERSIAEGGHPVFRCNQRLAIEIVACVENDEQSLDDVIDDLCEKVLAATLRNPAFCDKFEQINGLETEIEFGDEGEKPFAAARLTFDLQYVTQYPPIIEDEFETLHLKVQPTDPEGVVLEGDITIPTD